MDDYKKTFPDVPSMFKSITNIATPPQVIVNSNVNPSIFTQRVNRVSEICNQIQNTVKDMESFSKLNAELKNIKEQTEKDSDIATFYNNSVQNICSSFESSNVKIGHELLKKEFAKIQNSLDMIRTTDDLAQFATSVDALTDFITKCDFLTQDQKNFFSKKASAYVKYCNSVFNVLNAPKDQKKRIKKTEFETLKTTDAFIAGKFLSRLQSPI